MYAALLNLSLSFSDLWPLSSREEGEAAVEGICVHAQCTMQCVIHPLLIRLSACQH